MKNTVKSYLDRLKIDRSRRHRAAAVLVCLSLVVAGGTTWALHTTGESQTGQAYCGYEEHQHDESCIGEKTLICGYDAEDTSASNTGHTHSDSCYETQTVLTCTEAEHTHSEESGCYDGDGNLICQVPEHTHGASCYTEESVLSCGLEEGSGETTSTAAEHVHTDECYEVSYTCGKEVHQHTLSCYSNPEADLETAEDWEKTVSNVELTGDFATDLVAIAKTQLGYAESADNYQVVLDSAGNETAETMGYTRYGAWYGMPYENWCAMFVSFCLNYANITSEMLPYNAACQGWIDALSKEELGFYEPVLVEELDEDGNPVLDEDGNTILVRNDYTPEMGDLIFFDWDGDGSSDHVGIVEELETKETTNDDGTLSYTYIIHTIEGNSADAVAERKYDLEDETIQGYGSLYRAYVHAVDNELIENVRHLTAVAEDGASFSAIGEIPENAVLEVSTLTEEQNTYLQENGLTGTFYDIKILVDGEKYQPDSPVKISVSGLGYDVSTILEGYHLTVDAEDLMTSEDFETLSVDVQNTGNRIAFEADSFSIYGVGELAAETYLNTSNTVQGVSPASTIINLFDYTVSSEKENTGYSPNNGINSGHYFKFTSNGVGATGTANKWTGSGGGVLQGLVNKELTDGYPVLSGTSSLLPNSGNYQYWDSDNRLVTETYPTNDNMESLAYLFDSSTSESKKAYTDVQNLLQIDDEGYYYYDSNYNFAEYVQDTNSFTLYNAPAVSYGQQSGMFFPFDSGSSVSLNTSADSTSLNHFFGLTITTRFINRYNGYTTSAKDKATTFHFSGDDDVWIFIDDVLVADLGGIHDAASVDINFVEGTVTISTVYNKGSNVTTYFSDIFENTDVKLTTDGILENNSTHTLQFFYLERGGYASNLELKYNLTEIPATSIFKVDQYGDSVTGATFAFYPAYTDASGNWYYATTATATSGGVAASVVNANEIKYLEEGDATYNQWSISYTGNDGTVIIPALYYGKTDSTGSMTFVDKDGMPLSLKEIEDLLGDQFILREVEVPDGYRTVSDEAFLYISNHTTIISSDPYATGVWVSPNAQITATNTLYVASTSNELAAGLAESNPSIISGNETDGYTIKYYDAQNEPNGTLFAVVLKRNGADSTASTLDELKIAGWYPLYGNDEDGYNVSSGNNLASVIAAAKTQYEDYSNNVFEAQASGMQLTFTDLPGNPTQYYTYVEALALAGDDTTDVDVDNIEYVVAYYWTTEDIAEKGWESVTASNTVRVASHETTTATGDTGFDVLWGGTIEVPNVINALYFQKADSDGDLVDDAQFALYKAVADSTGTGYYEATDSSGNPVYIRLDEESGTAKDGAATVYTSLPADLTTGGTTGTYTMTAGTEAGKNSGYYTNDGAGTIEVTTADGSYTITPAKNAGTQSMVGYTHTKCDYVYEPGTGHFHLIPYGTYFLKEISAPNGYSLNYVNIPVEVTEEAVYANAGSTDNDVRVGNGVGYVVKTMDVFASLGNIDETLSWIYTHLKVADATTDFLDDADNTFYTHGYLSSEYKFKGFGKSNNNSTSYIPVGSLTDTNNLTEKTDTTGAMTQYLRYDGNANVTGANGDSIFDYDLYRTGEGVQSYRLWTESGWSDLAIYQDYDYGSAQTTTATDGTANPSTAYTNLTGYGEISYLFSSSTFVQIEDKVDVDLTVTKVTTDFEEADGNTATVYLDDAVFVLYRESDGETGSTKYYYTYDEDNDTTTFESVEEKDATQLTTVTTFTATDGTVYTVTTDLYVKDDGTYTKVYTLTTADETTETTYILSNYEENKTATFTPVTVTTNTSDGSVTVTKVENSTALTGTLARSYFKIYGLTEGTYVLHEVTTPTYYYTSGGKTTEQSFKNIGDMTITVKSGNYYWYKTAGTGNTVIVAEADIEFETVTNDDGSTTQIPKSFTYRAADGTAYKDVVLTANDDGTGYNFTVKDNETIITSNTLYLTTGNGFTLEVSGGGATRVVKVDREGTSAAYYDSTTTAYQGGFRVMNTSEASDATLTLVKVDETTITDTTGAGQNTAGYNEDSSEFTVTAANDDKTTYSAHSVLTGAKFYLYYTTKDDSGNEQNYYYGTSTNDNTTTVQWSESLLDANKFEVDTDGSLTFSSLNKSNTYYLVECQAPDGYNLLTEELEVEWVDTDGDGTAELTVTGVTSNQTYHLETVTTTTGEGDDTVTISTTYLVVYNTGGYALPKTGGAGTTMFTLGGIAILAMLTLVYGCGLRRRRERRAE